jgi:hypothetical protein
MNDARLFTLSAVWNPFPLQEGEGWDGGFVNIEFGCRGYQGTP